MSLKRPLALALAGLLVLAGMAEAAGGPSIGNSFELTTQNGTRFTDADLVGRPHLVFFGFTHCPEICPTTLFELSGAFEEMGPDAKAFRVLLVTVDPERDTQEQLQAYLGGFDERFLGLRGTPAQTLLAAQAFKATYRNVPLPGGDYTMDHTAVVYLMDANGRFVRTLDFRADRAEQIEGLRSLLAIPRSAP